MKYLTRTIFVSLFLILLANCDNNDSTKDLLTSQNWILEQYSRNGLDNTGNIYISNYKEDYFMDGAYERSYRDINGDLISEKGKWEFKNRDKEIHISDVSSIRQFSAENSTVSSSIYNINKLSETALVYSYDNGGDNHQFRLIPQ